MTASRDIQILSEILTDYFNNEENSLKSKMSSNKSIPHIQVSDLFSFNNVNNYNEKVVIYIPYLTITGEGTTKATYSSD